MYLIQLLGSIVAGACVILWLQMCFSNFELELLSFILAFFNKNILENQEITIRCFMFSMLRPKEPPTLLVGQCVSSINIIRKIFCIGIMCFFFTAVSNFLLQNPFSLLNFNFQVNFSGEESN